MGRQLADCRTCLDLGCGAGSPIRLLDFEYTVGLDGHEPGVNQARASKTHTEVWLGDVRRIGEYFSARQFDCVVALDLIEHLTKTEGLQLIDAMERIASKKILIFTPNGFLPQQSTDGDLQAHHSGWEAREIAALGFTVIGMHGHKLLRGERHEHRIRPQALGGVISVLTHYLYTRRHPEKAAAILCVKEVA
jgi:predicted TPR repeat methyltransferase